MNSTEKGKKLITISQISDREGNVASPPMINAIATRIDAVIREMGLSAQITIEEKGAGRKIHKDRRRMASSHRSPKRERDAKAGGKADVPLRIGIVEKQIVPSSPTVRGDH